MCATASTRLLQAPQVLEAQVSQTLQILEAFGVPLHRLTAHRKRRMSMVLLAVAGVGPGADWATAKDLSSGRSLKTRDIIALLNSAYHESISSGSYDDIRRKDLAPLVAQGIVCHTAPTAAHNSPNRGYALSPVYAALIRAHGSPHWGEQVAAHVKNVGSLAERLRQARQLAMTPVTLPGGRRLALTPGAHNDLQRDIVEKFLPRFGHGAEVLYLGDAADRNLHHESVRLRELGFPELDHGELPDVVAYSPSENWIYLIEAAHTFGPISPMRKARWEDLLAQCSAKAVFVTAFQNRSKFLKKAVELAWEQEVWLADEPDHLIHFNGDRFLGPH